MELSDITVGQRIRLTLPGVPAWNIPAQVCEATITAENLEAIRADAADQVTNGGATLEVIG